MVTTKARRRISGLALAAFLTTSLSLAGCGASTETTVTSTAETTPAGGSGSTSSLTSYWNTCPKNRDDDSFPGDCHEYADTNGDDICDLSQDDPDNSMAAIGTTAGDAGAEEDQSGDCPLGPCSICGICLSIG